jgi:hypothetical protein
MAEEPISLYLALEDGKTADLEVVAAASLAFVSAIREIAFIIDPSLEIRVEIRSGTEGSLSLNSIIKDLRDPKKRKKTLIAVATVVASWLGNDIRQWLNGKALDHITAVRPAEHHQLSQEEIEEIVAIVARLDEHDAGKPQRQKLYKELARDPAIEGVGVSPTEKIPPAVIVPRRQFGREAGTEVIEENVVSRRTVISRQWVTIISPVLIDSDRRWKFQVGKTEFGAPVRDHAFVEDVLSGRTAVPMRAGVQLEVELETTEEMKVGVWAPVTYVVTKVYQATPSTLPQTRRLPLSDESDDDSN